MAIPVGTRSVPTKYSASSALAAWGRCYRARDTRLGRDVAIKTLPAGLAADPERLRRFEIEAKAASLLSHPNIVSVYDIGTTDGQPYIVSELLDGETLRERLGRGPLAPRKAVEIGVAIAEALAAAHARGIVHRDLKPENLFLQRDGRPKILDFGIAKLTTAEPGNVGAAPTVSALTDVGVAVGTLGYMAPEQVRGEPVDHRTDIFAFGAVLHEMIAGTPAFRRDSRIATVNAVLEADPPSWPTPWPRRCDGSSSGASRSRLTSGSNPPAISRLRSTRSPTGTPARRRPRPSDAWRESTGDRRRSRRCWRRWPARSSGSCDRRRRRHQRRCAGSSSRRPLGRSSPTSRCRRTDAIS